MRVLRRFSLLVFMVASWTGSVALASSASVPEPETAASATSSPKAVATKAASPAAAVTEDASPAKDGGTLDGHISSIDYHSGKMTVDVGDGSAKKSYDVLVVPGTNIGGDKDFHTIADLKRGAHVQVLISKHGSTNTAQIIRLL